MSQAVNQVRRLLLVSPHRHHPSRNLSQNGMARVVVIQHHRVGGGAQLDQPLSFGLPMLSFIPVRFFIIYCVANAFPVVSPRYLDTLLLYIFLSPLPMVMHTHKCIPLQICAVQPVEIVILHICQPVPSLTPRRPHAASCSHVTI